MAKIFVLATLAAVLQLAGTLTEPDCRVMESGFVYLSNRACNFARLYFFYWTPGGEDSSREVYWPLLLAAAYVSM